MSARTIAVVSAGLGDPSTTRLLAGQLGAAVVLALQEAERSSLDPDAPVAEQEPATVVHVELRRYAHELADALLTGFPSGALRAAVDEVIAADGLVVVSPTFSASYSGLFKTFFDVLEMDSLRGKPVLLAATGGTERHSLVLEYALRPLFVYLGADPVRTGVYAATSDFGGDGSPAVCGRVDRAAQELAAALLGRRPAASAGGADGQVAPLTVTPFEELLGRR